jgi:hypothetical protein
MSDNPVRWEGNAVVPWAEWERLQAVVDWARENSFLTNSIIKGRGDDAPIYVRGDYGIVCIRADRYAIIPREDYEPLRAVMDSTYSQLTELLRTLDDDSEMAESLRTIMDGIFPNLSQDALRALGEVKP